MHIGLIRQRYAPDGGAERFVARALAALHAQGVSLTLITRQWERSESFNVVTCNPFYIGSLWRDWGFARCVRKVLARRSLDLVQSHERIALCDIYRAGDGVHREWLRQRRRTLGLSGKLALALNPYHHYVKAAEKRLFNSPRLRAVICNSHMVKQEIKHYFGVADEKLHVIYSGVDTNQYRPGLRRYRGALRAQHRIPQDAPLFLFVGSGFERKGVSLLLDAMARLPGDSYLMVVGKDKKMRLFLARAAKLNIADRVCFAGTQPDVKPFYGAADALVLPTLYDPFPNVVLEAMASGLPVITSYKCGAAELIRNGDNGFICDALDKAALVESMRILLEQNRRESMAVAARKSMEPLTLEAMSKRLMALYDQVIIEKRV
ncbi:MAG TPA: glycosyltransferase family 4 protein [Acidiferrobacterales bacterium]|nr:glycosyltransferase family 4 protein [Acidiferrobacterales bacterium]